MLSPSSLTKLSLPIDLTDYRVVNVALFFLPLSTVWLLSFSDQSTALASLLLVCLFIPVPWTIYLAIKSCSTNTEAEFPLMRFFWMLGGLFLVLGILLTLGILISGNNSQ
jgi:hypothetical protein